VTAGEPHLSVVIPARDEAATIGVVLDALRGQLARGAEALVVVDTVDDATAPAVEAWSAACPEASVRVVLTRGRGVIDAIRTGFADARGRHVLLTMADLSDDLADVPALLALVERGADVACASRYSPGGRQIGAPVVKSALSRLAGLSLHWIAGVPTRDATNSFKLWPRGFLARTPIESGAGFAASLELVVKAHEQGLAIAEVPTTWRERSSGASRFRLVAWLPQYLRWWLRGLRVGIGRRLGLGRARARAEG